MQKTNRPSTDGIIKCNECNGLGATGWGPTAEPCLQCGGMGYVPHVSPDHQPPTYTTLSEDEINDIIGDA